MITLHSASLLSKWGFDDGDLLWDFLYDLDNGHRAHKINHEVLVATVQKWLLPALDQQVETYVMELSSHNPIRAESVDGVSVEVDGRNLVLNLLTPASVEVSEDDIRDLALGML